MHKSCKTGKFHNLMAGGYSQMVRSKRYPRTIKLVFIKLLSWHTKCVIRKAQY